MMKTINQTKFYTMYFYMLTVYYLRRTKKVL